MTGSDLPVPSETERAAARQQSELSLLRSYTGIVGAANARLKAERDQLSSMLRAMARRAVQHRRAGAESNRLLQGKDQWRDSALTAPPGRGRRGVRVAGRLEGGHVSAGRVVQIATPTTGLPCDCPDCRDTPMLVIAVNEHEYALDGHPERDERWRWLCGCGSRGKYQYQSPNCSYHSWRVHAGLKVGADHVPSPEPALAPAPVGVEQAEHLLTFRVPRGAVPVPAPPTPDVAEHHLVEIMASSWDELGHRPPTNWRALCSCGFSERRLRTQVDALDAFADHKRRHDEGDHSE